MLNFSWSITIWLALDDVDELNGCCGFYWITQKNLENIEQHQKIHMFLQQMNWMKFKKV